jgi:hypothetical protein
MAASARATCRAKAIGHAYGHPTETELADELDDFAEEVGAINSERAEQILDELKKQTELLEALLARSRDHGL